MVWYGAENSSTPWSRMVRVQPDYLHNHKDFPDLIRIVGEQMKIAPVLVEIDYWIMHCLYGLQQMGMKFEFKGGTSLCKGFHITSRFSEDIDIRIDPPADLNVSVGRNHNKPAQIESRKRFYDWVATAIKMDGIHDIARDTAFACIIARSLGWPPISRKASCSRLDLMSLPPMLAWISAPGLAIMQPVRSKLSTIERWLCHATHPANVGGETADHFDQVPQTAGIR
jgi:hypothetical protein